MEQQPATIVKNAIEPLSQNIRFMSGEIATFKEAICGVIEQMNRSSNKMLATSIIYFVASIVLSTAYVVATWLMVFKK